MSYLHEMPRLGAALRLPAGDSAVEQAVAAYRLDVHERWNRYKRDFGDPRWEIPFDYAADRAKPLWERSRNPKPQQFPACLGLDGFPVRRGHSCGHLHFAQGVNPAHQEELQEEDQDGAWYRNEDDRW